jgi:hypothetical protein
VERPESVISSTATTTTTKIEEEDRNLQEEKEEKGMGETVVPSSLHDSEVKVKKGGRRLLPVTSIAIVLAILILLIGILYHE